GFRGLVLASFSQAATRRILMSRGDLSKAKMHVLIFTLFCSVGGVAQTTVVRTTEIDDVLVNPGMGIETFNRFVGEELNEGTTWSEVGPETALPDAPPRAVGFPGSSVAYLRWFWSQLESQPGK